jgi:hypothetical protein
LVAVAVFVLLGTTPGCSLFDDEPEASPTSAPASSPSPSAIDAPPDVLGGLSATLDRRAKALLRGDPRPVLAGLARGDRVLREEQQTYVENVRQLPLAEVSFDLVPQSLVRIGDDYRAEVLESLRLEGFDTAPVVTRRRFVFTPAGKSTRFLIAGLTDPEWEAQNPGGNHPWDLGPIAVVRTDSALGILDEASVPAGQRLMASVERGIAEVASVVPSAWNRTVVVYALSDLTYLSSLPDVPGGDPFGVDAVALPVYGAPAGSGADPGTRDLAATRIVMSPVLLGQPGRARDRLIRHELTHVALGEADDGVPLWLSEGIAEYVSVQALPTGKRAIPPATLDAAEAGITDLPTDAEFAAPGGAGRSATSYGIAWFACEYLAQEYGEVALWQILQAMSGSSPDPDEVLGAVISLNSRTLARKAGKLLLATYRPPEPSPSPTASASPSGSPSPSASVAPSGSPSPGSSPSAGPSPSSAPSGDSAAERPAPAPAAW